LWSQEELKKEKKKNKLPKKENKGFNYLVLAPLAGEVITLFRVTLLWTVFSHSSDFDLVENRISFFL
jgi:hypothetical protein